MTGKDLIKFIQDNKLEDLEVGEYGGNLIFGGFIPIKDESDDDIRYYICPGDGHIGDLRHEPPEAHIEWFHVISKLDDGDYDKTEFIELTTEEALKLRGLM